MIHDKKHLKYTAIPNEEMYWERVNRSLGWLGDTKQEQHNKQEKLKNVVIGIAGTGGIGGQLAQRLVRMGVRNLKLADPDTFDISNMNRQMGADLQHIGKNKAEVVAEMTYSLNHDVNIAVYPEGITKETAEDFVQDCDYVLDQMEFYEIANRYALHRAFRKSGLAPFFWMSLNGEKNTGVSCIEVTPEIDGGDIVLQRKVRLTGNENSLEVREKLFKASFSLFNDVLDLICQGPLKTHKQDMTKRDYHSNPSQADKTITNNDTVSSALAKLKACAPSNAYVQINDNVFKVNSVSWSQTSKTKLKLKDGRLSFFLENAL